MEKTEHVLIDSLSSINLRSGRKMTRKMKEYVLFCCDVCRKRKILGKGSVVLLKIGYKAGTDVVEYVLCDRCADILTDIVRFGPVVLRQPGWRIISRVAKVSLVRCELFCWLCRRVEYTHVQMKFDDFRVAGMSPAYGTKKVCSRCVAGAIGALRVDDSWKRFVGYVK
jgi:hypothetical protein